jgi:hypothetical protein
MRFRPPPPVPPALQVRNALIVVARWVAGFAVQLRGRFRLARSSIAMVSLAAILLGALPGTAAAVVRITDDEGGNIGDYWSRFMALRNSGEPVVIDGTCASACTMVLGIVPSDRICVTRNAVFGFHAAYRGFLVFRVTNDPATRTLFNLYPGPIRHWITRNGGLGPTTIYLSGRELFAMYRQCH